MDSPLARIRRSLGQTAEGSVAYRLTLRHELDADRATYVQRVESLTDGLEASIRDAGSGAFESVAVSRTAGPYSRTMYAINEEKMRVRDFDAWLDEFGETGAPLLSSMTVADVSADRKKAARRLDELQHNERPRTEPTFVYTVSFTPKSSQAIEAIASEFDRLSTLDGVEAVTIESDAPDEDPRNSIDIRRERDP